jgi:transposase
MIQRQLKLKLTKEQKATLNSWLRILGKIWNFAVRKIELNAKNKVYFSKHKFQNLLAGHSKKLQVPSHTIQGMLLNAYSAWERCFKGISRKPRLKGAKRPCNSIPLPDPIKIYKNNRVGIPELGKVKLHKQGVPEGKIKCGMICKRASGWYLCLFIDAEPVSIERTGENIVGIDPGFKDLLTLNTGEKIGHPKEFRTAEKRLGQAQRGNRKKLIARIHERVKNKRKDRNHKLSRRLVSENKTIYFLKDNHRAVAKRFGKSVGDSAHGQLRLMLEYKSLNSGTQLVFPENRNSTRTCSTCGALTGPTGLAGLKVRNWKCSVCGAEHERDTNSAQNAYNFGVGLTHEEACCVK